jgi:hypothetical protein
MGISAVAPRRQEVEQKLRNGRLCHSTTHTFTHHATGQPTIAVPRAGNSASYEKTRTASPTLFTCEQSCGTPPSPHSAIDREFRLDQILLALWHGRLTADAAAERIVTDLGMSHFQARDEVDGFLRD